MERNQPDLKTAVIIPALNEADTIGRLVHETQKQRVEHIIVVDNGSIDETARLAVEQGAQVVTEMRQGYGYACAAGTRIALRESADVLVYMDGDFSSLPSELSRLLEPLERDQADLVLGSRTLGQIAPGAMPPHQRFGNWLSSRLMSRLYSLQITDLGPYRAVRASFLIELDMREMTFGWPTEMMVKTARAGGRIIEVPVCWHVRQGGRSKVSGTLRGSLLATYHILAVTARYARS